MSGTLRFKTDLLNKAWQCKCRFGNIGAWIIIFIMPMKLWSCIIWQTRAKMIGNHDWYSYKSNHSDNGLVIRAKNHIAVPSFIRKSSHLLTTSIRIDSSCVVDKQLWDYVYFDTSISWKHDPPYISDTLFGYWLEGSSNGHWPRFSANQIRLSTDYADRCPS